jgi:hypothetical protein
MIAPDDWVASVARLYDAKSKIDLTEADITSVGAHMPDVDLEQLCDSILGNLRLPKV